MSIQLTTAPGALSALGLGAGDVASIIALSKRVGNWWTAGSGDQEMLSLLDESEHDIITRGGLLDPREFNARWRKRISLLANGNPLHLNDKQIGKVLNDIEHLVENMSLFTSTMVCLIAVLDQFADKDIVQSIANKLLMGLLKPGPNGEEIINSQCKLRINSWRSTSCLRGLNTAAQECRRKLIDEKRILSGHFPQSESHHVEEFLWWLLGSKEPQFSTNSSDVAGIAAGLCYLGMDIIDIQGPGFADYCRGTCMVIYSEEQVLHGNALPPGKIHNVMLRDPSTIVPLDNPWESVSTFPITTEAQNKCRTAWKAGIKAAGAIQICVSHIEAGDSQFFSRSTLDINYLLVDVGESIDRCSPEIYTLAEKYGLVVNKELLEGLDDCLGLIPPDILVWINDTTLGDDAIVVEGSWAFRSSELIHFIHDLLKNTAPRSTHDLESPLHVKRLSRQDLLPLLLRLFMGNTAISPRGKTSAGVWKDCIGVVGKRTLLINSLLGKCSSPREIGGFTLLDVDTGGIPRDHNGLVSPGTSPALLAIKVIDSPGEVKDNINEDNPDEDVEFGIEADWEGNPDTSLICARYKGRRVAAVTPAETDYCFCKNYVPPQSDEKPMPDQRTKLDHGMSVRLSDVMMPSVDLPLLRDINTAILFQALDRPKLRYIGAALYSTFCTCRIASDSIQTAKDVASLMANGNGTGYKSPIVLIAGLTTSSKLDRCITSSYTTRKLYVITKEKESA